MLFSFFIRLFPCNQVFLLIFMSAITQSAIAQSEKFGQMIYTVPSAWKLAKYQNGALISPGDLPPKEYLAIQIMQPMNFSATMEQVLEKAYDETCNLLR